MAIPELVRRAAERQLAAFIDEQTPLRCVAGGRLTWERNDDQLTLFLQEVEDGQLVRRPVARFRFSNELGQWTLHHLHRQGQDRWVLYLNASASLEFGRLLKALAADPFHFFWPD